MNLKKSFYILATSLVSLGVTHSRSSHTNFPPHPHSSVTVHAFLYSRQHGFPLNNVSINVGSPHTILKLQTTLSFRHLHSSSDSQLSPILQVWETLCGFLFWCKAIFAAIVASIITSKTNVFNIMTYLLLSYRCQED